MAKFIKANFKKGEYVFYPVDGEDKFIARFKYRSGGSGAFITFLCKNFEVEEYFALLENSTPLEVLNAKGYISPNIRKILKHYNLPITAEGVESLNEINRREARV